jgi:L-arabinose isomerase
VLPVVREVDVPVIVLSLQPSKAIEYTSFNALGDRGKMTGEWLAYCQACSAPEIASVFNRAKIDYHLITGSLDDESSWNEIDDWLNAVKVASILDDTRIGALGHYYEGMLDVYSDMTQLSSTFGCHFEILEMSTLYKYYNETTNAQFRRRSNNSTMILRLIPRVMHMKYPGLPDQPQRLKPWCKIVNLDVWHTIMKDPVISGMRISSHL